MQSNQDGHPTVIHSHNKIFNYFKGRGQEDALCFIQQDYSQPKTQSPTLNQNLWQTLNLLSKINRDLKPNNKKNTLKPNL